MNVDRRRTLTRMAFLPALLACLAVLLAFGAPVMGETMTDRNFREQKSLQKQREERLKQKADDARKERLRKEKSTGGRSKGGGSGKMPDGGLKPFDPDQPPMNGLMGEVAFDILMQNLSEYCGYNLILDKPSKKSEKTILVYNNAKLTRAETCELWRQLLELDETSFYQANGFLKVLDRSKAGEAPIPIGTTNKVPSGPKVDMAMAVYIPKYQLQYAGHFASLARFFLTPSGKTIFIAPDATVIIDERDNVLKIFRIFDLLDRPEPPFFIYYIPVQHMVIKDFQNLVAQLFPKPDLERWHAGKGAGYGPRYQVAAVASDERAGVLTVICNEAAYEKILELRDALDVETATAGQAQVQHLQHQLAKDVAATLNAVIKGSGASGAKGGKDNSAVTENEVNIVADEKLNAIIVSGKQKDVDEIIRVIRRLDSPRRQVFLEVHILELSTSKTGAQGVGLYYARNQDGSVGIVSSAHSGAQPFSLDAASLTGMAVGAVSSATVAGSEDMFGIALPSFGAILRFISTSADVNIISEPFLLAMDGEEAQMVVGKNVPFISGGAVSSLGSLSTTIQHQDVALTLKIKPTVGKHGTVKMVVELELQDILSLSDTMGPTTSKRAVKTTVIVKDGSNAVVGGLMKTIDTEDHSKTPLLSELPVIGWLFKTKSARHDKTNLLIFIRPFVVDGPEDMKNIYRIKMRENEEFVRAFSQDATPAYEPPPDFDRCVGPLESINKSFRPTSAPPPRPTPGDSRQYTKE